MSVWDDLKKEMLAWDEQERQKAEAARKLRAFVSKLPDSDRKQIEFYLDQIAPPAA